MTAAGHPAWDRVTVLPSARAGRTERRQKSVVLPAEPCRSAAMNCAGLEVITPNTNWASAGHLYFVVIADFLLRIPLDSYVPDGEEGGSKNVFSVLAKYPKEHRFKKHLSLVNS